VQAKAHWQAAEILLGEVQAVARQPQEKREGGTQDVRAQAVRRVREKVSPCGRLQSSRCEANMSDNEKDEEIARLKDENKRLRQKNAVLANMSNALENQVASIVAELKDIIEANS
jgi:hypothetical protein